jgi:hypothetical protein
MTVRYHVRRGELRPDYVCQQLGIQTARRICQCIPGAGIDQAIGTLLVETVTPVALEVALQVQQELETRADEADRLRHKQVERARYEAELARRRYMQVDPDYRLVADALEAEWNEKLRALSNAQEQYEKRRAAERGLLAEEHRDRILSLAADFSRLWKDPKTQQRDRKRMVRLLIEDATLVKADGITVHVRFKGGASKSLSLPIPPSAWQLRQTPAEVVALVDHLLDQYTEGQIASILNERGFSPGERETFHRLTVKHIRNDYKLKSRRQRLRDNGMLTLTEMARLLGVSTATVKRWRHHGLLRVQVENDKGECLYELPGENAPVKQQGRKLSERRRFPVVHSDRADEV